MTSLVIEVLLVPSDKALNADFNGNSRMHARPGFQPVGVGKGGHDIARLHGLHVFDRGFAQQGFNGLDEGQQRHGLAVPDVEHAVRRP